MYEELSRYLNGEGYYNWGVKLLQQLNHSAGELREFERYTKATFAPIEVSRRLETALRVHFSQMSPPQYNRQNVPKNDHSTKENADIDTPVEIQQLRERFILLLKERAAIHGSLEAHLDQENRAIAAERILNLTSDINRISENLRLFKTDGIIPLIVSEVAETAAQSVLKLTKTEKYLKERISRLQSDKYLRAKDLATPKRAEYEAELTQKKELLVQLTLQIEALS